MEKAEETEWKPNDELLVMLMDMGISKIAAEHALFYTGNTSAEAAASYVFDNFENDDDASITLPAPLKVKQNQRPTDSTIPSNDVEDSDEDDIISYKMVLVVNTSLNMGIGKLAAQVAHASLGLYRILKDYPHMESAVDSWVYEGEKKVVLKGNDHLQLQELQKKAESTNLHSYLVQDAGRTQIPPNSITVLALFGEEKSVNLITGQLHLL